jgi:hypothetical protein
VPSASCLVSADVWGVWHCRLLAAHDSSTQSCVCLRVAYSISVSAGDAVLDLSGGMPCLPEPGASPCKSSTALHCTRCRTHLQVATVAYVSPGR